MVRSKAEATYITRLVHLKVDPTYITRLVHLKVDPTYNHQTTYITERRTSRNYETDHRS
jgi:hypothetical protein